jgi:hypothetical protein
VQIRGQEIENSLLAGNLGRERLALDCVLRQICPIFQHDRDRLPCRLYSTRDPGAVLHHFSASLCSDYALNYAAKIGRCCMQPTVRMMQEIRRFIGALAEFLRQRQGLRRSAVVGSATSSQL